MMRKLAVALALLALPVAAQEAELTEVNQCGAVGELLGQFLDAKGRLVAASLTDRSLSLRLEDLKGKSVVAMAGGPAKVKAIEAVLKSGVLTGLITDERTAAALTEGTQDGGSPAATKRPRVSTMRRSRGSVSHSRRPASSISRARRASSSACEVTRTSSSAL